MAIERKPENGCEMKTSSCGRSGIMTRIEITRGKELSENLPFEECYNHSTSGTFRLVQPWLEPNRVVCADSWFSSVETAIALLQRQTKYIGAIKTATKEYPITELEVCLLSGRGAKAGLVSRDHTGK